MATHATAIGHKCPNRRSRCRQLAPEPDSRLAIARAEQAPRARWTRVSKRRNSGPSRESSRRSRSSPALIFGGGRAAARREKFVLRSGRDRIRGHANTRSRPRLSTPSARLARRCIAAPRRRRDAPRGRHAPVGTCARPVLKVLDRQPLSCHRHSPFGDGTAAKSSRSSSPRSST
jgi:hypothetical protein